jgi:hypothetical protein
MKSTEMTVRTANVSDVAVPRLQPRAASQFTAGSMAKERNSETTSVMSRLASCATSQRDTKNPAAPRKNSRMAWGTQRGMASRLRTACSSSGGKLTWSRCHIGA